jgi:predicted nucleotidyltransferase
MSQIPEDDFPSATREQIRSFSDELSSVLGSSMVGLYLHGSLAMGCFNPNSSDIDLLAVSNEYLSLDKKRQLAELLLKESGAPHPIEISTLVTNDLRVWQYPTPFDFHFSEMWREQVRADIEGESWKQWNDKVRRDPDLAAHIMVVRQRGVRLNGEPISSTFPAVPSSDYLESILEDVSGALYDIMDHPVYAVLNTCRVLAYLADGQICSKKEGGVWALDRVPNNLRSTVATAMSVYAGGIGREEFDPDKLAEFSAYASQALASTTELE